MDLKSAITVLTLLACLWAPGTSFAQQTVVIVFDDSGSMDDRMSSTGERRIDTAKQALTNVLDELPADTRVGVLALNSQVNGSSWIVPLGRIDESDWRSNVASLEAVGGTPLGDYLKTGANALLEAREKQIYGEYRLLVVTDGEANDPALVDAFIPQILGRGLTIDAIGVDMQSDHSLATKVNSYRRADDDTSLQEAISQVFAETSTDDMDASDDFAMLEGLPDGFAEEAIAALTEVNNQPLETPQGARGGAYIRNGQAASWASVLFGLGCLCFGGLLILVILLVIVSKAAKRSR
ncbi:MAG: hypothetical protein Aurels2KO_24210 [Aureliella sp.]